MFAVLKVFLEKSGRCTRLRNWNRSYLGKDAQRPRLLFMSKFAGLHALLFALKSLELLSVTPALEHLHTTGRNVSYEKPL